VIQAGFSSQARPGRAFFSAFYKAQMPTGAAQAYFDAQPAQFDAPQHCSGSLHNQIDGPHNYRDAPPGQIDNPQYHFEAPLTSIEALPTRIEGP
jgi:hypothetical protein